ncbi:MAG: PP2C family protein-serine/threonine phosphatase [Bryobacteraceae bacterium]
MIEPKKLLVGEDQPDVREALRLLFKGAGYQTETADSPARLLRAAEEQDYDVILLDMNYARDTTSGDEGIELLGNLRRRHCDTPVVVMTAWASLELAIEAMRKGASDFIQKPWDNARLIETVERQRLRRVETLTAQRIQARLLPHEPKPLRTAICDGATMPAREVGGDYYDFLDLGGSEAGLVLADASGKGVAGALLMANLRSSVRTLAGTTDTLALGREVNRQFFESTPPEQYATLFFGRYDDATRTLQYVNCGHCAPMIARADGRTQRLEPTATVIGLFADWSGEERQTVLGPGDRLVIYSDGVVEAGGEACGDAGEEFGEDRLLAHLRSGASAAGILRAVRAFEPADDATVVVVRGRAA